MLTCMSGCLSGSENDSAQTQHFEEGGCLLVELTQLSLCPRQVHTGGKQGSSGERGESQTDASLCELSTSCPHVHHLYFFLHYLFQICK